MFLLIWPIILLPIIFINNVPAMRCLYTISVMAGLWVTECLPLGVTALIPIVAFPVFGILNTAKTSICYFKDTNMMFLGDLICNVIHC